MNYGNIKMEAQFDTYAHVPNIAEPREGETKTNGHNRPCLQGAQGLRVGRWNVEAAGDLVPHVHVVLYASHTF